MYQTSKKAIANSERAMPHSKCEGSAQNIREFIYLDANMAENFRLQMLKFKLHISVHC